MNSFRSLHQTYKELPWRKRVRYLATALAVVLGVSAFFFLEIHYSTQAILLGRRVQQLQSDIQSGQLEIVLLESQLARLTSLSNLQSEAKSLGYKPVQPSHVHYVPVPAWALEDDRKPLNAPQPAASEELPPKYTVSLVEWLTSLLISPRAGQ